MNEPKVIIALSEYNRLLKLEAEAVGAAKQKHEARLEAVPIVCVVLNTIADCIDRRPLNARLDGAAAIRFMAVESVIKNYIENL